MRKILFLFATIGLMYSAIGQKATGDKPTFSRDYSFSTINDSTLSCLTFYTYNNDQRIVKEISDYSSSQDSTLTAYDAKGRIISVNRFSDGELSLSEVWNYDDANSNIYYYIHSNGEVQPSGYIAFYAVDNMDAIDGEIHFSLMSFDIVLRNCDSIYINAYDAGSSSWIPVVKISPKSSGNKITSATMVIDGDYIGEIIPIGDLLPISISELTINLALAYQGDDLSSIKGSTTITVPILGQMPLTDFVTVNYQYNGNNLTESTTIMDVAAMGTQVVYAGIKETYLYNQEGNILCRELYSSSEKNTWTLNSKVWYFFADDIYDDLSVDLGGFSGDSDEIGKSMSLRIYIQNNAATHDFSDVGITAIVEDESGEIAKETGTFSLFKNLAFSPYTFDNLYTVPDVEEYTITIYIESNDDNPLNDTLRVVRKTHEAPPINIANVENLGIVMGQNIPNPASNSTRIEYSVVEAGQVNFSLYSISGQLLLQQTEYVTKGNHQMEINTANLANGIYFYSMEINGNRITKRMSVKK